ncbi:CHAP domain-containing protein [Nocardia vaccinii]|uniref:CHAP domain-containing protein n=1 Tax=Nocardia vaccinii TaxID=1822 RepID=UPI00082E2C5F|nr:CHAP domain-containing protein [Nocardia vaccinii]
MSPNTFDINEITLTPPNGARTGLIAVLDMVQTALRQSIGLLASGKPSEQPDLLHELGSRGLLQDGLDDKHDHAVMVDSYASSLQQIRAAKLAISSHNEDVRKASYSTFDISNGTFTACMSKVRQLQGALAEMSKRNKSGAPLTPSQQRTVITAALDAVDYVHGKVSSARKQIHHQKQVIENSAPTYHPGLTYPSGGVGGDGPYPFAPRTGSIIPIPLAPGASGAVQAAMSQLGVHELGSSNHLPGHKAYDIGGPWCASFATWAWRQAHLPLNWTTSTTYVPTIWADAKRHGLADRASGARVGDLIVLNDVGHIGVVEKVDSHGNIYTIEGNSGDAVRRHEYPPGSSYVDGVIHPPAQKPGAVMA